MKKIGVLIITLTMFLLMMGISTAVDCANGDTGSITVNSPTTNTYVTATMDSQSSEAPEIGINVSGCFKSDEDGTAGEDDYNITVLNFEYQRSDESTWSSIGRNGTEGVTLTNVTAYGITWNTIDLVDKDIYTYTFRVTPGNASDNQTASTVTIRVDNTAPVVALSTGQTSDTTYTPTTTWTFSATNSSTCNIYFGTNNYVGTMVTTIGAETCTTTGPVPEGVYDVVYATAHDGRNLTTSTSLTNIKIEGTTGGGGGTIVGSSGTSNSAFLASLGFDQTGTGSGGVNPVAVIVVIGLGLLFFTKGGQKLLKDLF